MCNLKVKSIFNTYVCTLLQLFTDVHLFQEKNTLRHVENVIMMFNNAGFSDNVYLSFRMRLLAQAAVFTMRYFNGYINDAVTSLGNNFSITQ